MHIRDQFSGRVQECEEELSMALKELQREQASVKIISMQNREVRGVWGDEWRVMSGEWEVESE